MPDEPYLKNPRRKSRESGQIPRLCLLGCRAVHMQTIQVDTIFNLKPPVGQFADFVLSRLGIHSLTKPGTSSMMDCELSFVNFLLRSVKVCRQSHYLPMEEPHSSVCRSKRNLQYNLLSARVEPAHSERPCFLTQHLDPRLIF